MVLRCCLGLKLYGHAQKIADELLGTMERSWTTTSTSELLLETCRVAIAGRRHQQVIWAGSTLKRLTMIEDFPPLPSSVLNLYIDQIHDSAALDFYTSIPKPKRPCPSPRNILRLAAAAQRSKPILLELLHDINRIPPDDFIAQRPGFLRCLADAGLVPVVQGLYAAWADSFILNADLMSSIVRCFVSRQDKRSVMKPAGPRSRKGIIIENGPIASAVHKVLRDFQAIAITSADHLALARAHLMVNDPTSARRALSALDSSDPHIPKLFGDLAMTDPVAAFDITGLAAAAQLPIGMTAAIVSQTCAKGRWDVLQAATKRAMSPSDEREISILRLIRAGTVHSALQEVQDARNDKIEVSAQTYRLLLSRAVVGRHWAMALGVFEMVSEEGEEDVAMFAKHGSVLLSIRSENVDPDDDSDMMAMAESQDIVAESDCVSSQADEKESAAKRMRDLMKEIKRRMGP